MPDPADLIVLPVPVTQLVGPDGRPTRELLELLQRIKDAIDDHEARLDAIPA